MWYLVPLAVIGAFTLGIVLGIMAGRQDNKEWLSLYRERIEVLEASVATYRQSEEEWRQVMKDIFPESKILPKGRH